MKMVVTHSTNEDVCACQYCGTTIAVFTEEGMVPSAEQCYRNGNVPIPNFGWFCSQQCANQYEVKYNINFERMPDGRIDYYHKDPNV